MEIDASWYERPPGTPERLTAGGLVCALRDGQTVVALVREGDWPAYLIPKGGVEAGEAIEEAARREIAEEAGFTRLTLLGKVGVLERLTFDRALVDRHPHLRLRHRGTRRHAARPRRASPSAALVPDRGAARHAVARPAPADRTQPRPTAPLVGRGGRLIRDRRRYSVP